MSLTLHTSHGDLKCKLYWQKVPKTSRNFIALAAKGYYNGTVFHRNIKGFIIQGGDPTGTGKGGRSIYGKHFEDEIRPEYVHNGRGILSMANSGPNTNGSQFFITYNSFDHLDGKNTIFGKLSDGYEVLDRLEKQPVGKANRPLNEVKIISVTIHDNPIAIMEYEAVQEGKKEEDKQDINIKAKILEKFKSYEQVQKNIPFLVTISGIPGAGKTTLANQLAKQLSSEGIKTVNLSMDGFHYPISQLKKFKNPDFVIYRRGAPYTFHSELLYEKLTNLKDPDTKTVKFPGFQHQKGDPVFDQIIIDKTVAKIILLQGNYLLFDGKYSEDIEKMTEDFYKPEGGKEYWDKVSGFGDYKIYIERDLDECMEGLCQRNKVIPGYTEEEIRNRVMKSDKLNAKLVQLSKEKADVVVQIGN